MPPNGGGTEIQMKRKFSSLTALVLCVLFTFSLLSPLAIEAKTIGPRTLYLNQTIKGLTIEPGDLYVFEFTAPETGYYIVETFGSVDTYGKVRENAKVIMQDDDNGYGMNCAVGFRITKDVKVTVEITVNSSATQGGPFSIAVSRQLANIYTFKYPDGLSTLLDSQLPSQYLRNLGYKVSIRKNMLKSTAIVNAQSQNYPWLCSEVLLFSGHGAPGKVIFTDGQNLQDELTSADMKKDPNEYSMQQTKLVVWSSCYSAEPNKTNNTPSMIVASTTNGADAAVGWRDSITSPEARAWNDTFFKYMSQAKTVRQAIDATNETYLGADITKSVWAYGNESTVITARAPNKRTPADPRSIKEAEEKKVKQIEDIAKNYTKKEDLETLTLYIKEINGIQTNDYYSIHKDDGKIIKSPWEINEEEAIQLKNILDTYPEYLNREPLIPQSLANNPSWTLSKIKSKTIFIAKIDGKVMPVKQIYAEYNNPSYEYPEVQSYYFNLLDGSTVDYSPEKINEAWTMQENQ